MMIPSVTRVEFIKTKIIFRYHTKGVSDQVSSNSDHEIKSYSCSNSSTKMGRLNFLLVARCWLLLARCSLLFASCSLLFARCSLLFARSSLLFTCCSTRNSEGFFLSKSKQKALHINLYKLDSFKLEAFEKLF